MHGAQQGHPARGPQVAGRSHPPRAERGVAVRELPLPSIRPKVPGAGPEQGQQRRARSALEVAIAGTPVADRRMGRGVNFVDADAVSPQVFTSHPRITHAVAASTISGDTAWPHLPGRMPPAGWDGEPGAAAPVEVDA